jgi:hypothetical protein
VIQSSNASAECAVRLYVFAKYTPLCPFPFLQRRRDRHGYEGIDTTFFPDFWVSSMGISKPRASLDMPCSYSESAVVVSRSGSVW